MGNQVSTVMNLIPPDECHHGSSTDNPEDCDSRGLNPSELLQHPLWWTGPTWLKRSPADWPKQSTPPLTESLEEEREISHLVIAPQLSPIVPLDRYSSFNQLKRVTALVLQFLKKGREQSIRIFIIPVLSADELHEAEC